LILNADPFPRSVSIALFLIDRKSANVPAGRLGVSPVNSSPDLTASQPAPVSETLEFSFPPSPHLSEFDEIKLVFRRSRGRADKSARIAINGFVLVPAE
jgi:hypothetical protein